MMVDSAMVSCSNLVNAALLEVEEEENSEGQYLSCQTGQLPWKRNSGIPNFLERVEHAGRNL